uniref:Glutaredoxin-1 n=1 Tax=Athene cunicularia TaxID=194338 RepID=A0A663NBA9_ATHCN
IFNPGHAPLGSQGSVAETFVKSKLRDDRVTLFVKDICPYCRNALEMLRQYNLRPECLQVCNITGMQSIQEYFRQTTGRREMLGTCSPHRPHFGGILLRWLHVQTRGGAQPRENPERNSCSGDSGTASWP